MMDRGKFFAVMRPLFGGHLNESQVQGTGALLDAIEKAGPIDTRWQAYMLATAYHETAHTMQPIEEIGKGHSRAYGHPAGPWHRVYDGRGDVQLTWEANYVKATARLRALGAIGDDVDLDQHPDLAMQPDIAAAIMIHGMIEGWFTGKKLADFFNDETTDNVHARKIINGLDRADAIASYARQFHDALITANS